MSLIDTNVHQETTYNFLFVFLNSGREKKHEGGRREMRGRKREGRKMTCLHLGKSSTNIIEIVVCWVFRDINEMWAQSSIIRKNNHKL